MLEVGRNRPLINRGFATGIGVLDGHLQGANREAHCVELPQILPHLRPLNRRKPTVYAGRGTF